MIGNVESGQTTVCAWPSVLELSLCFSNTAQYKHTQKKYLMFVVHLLTQVVLFFKLWKLTPLLSQLYS